MITESEMVSVGSGPDPGAAEYDGSVVHVATEYWPYARTGGLAEAVRGIATYQARAGRRIVVFMPLYGKVREAFPSIRPCGPAFEVEGGTGPIQARIYHDVSTGEGDPRIYFVENDAFFDRPAIYGEASDYPDNHLRFSFLSRAVLKWLAQVVESPVLLHLHDWHTALAAVYLRNNLSGRPFFDEIATVLTVHNAGYQGHYGPEVLREVGLEEDLFRWDRMEWYGKVNILKGGLVFSDMVTTVSPTHAHELRTRAGGFGLHDSFTALHDRFLGILNGIDYSVWDPANDPWIEANFSRDDLSGKAVCKRWFQNRVGLTADPEIPLFALSARLVEQKGLDLLLGSDMIPGLEGQFVFLGEGERRYRDAIVALAEAAPHRVGYSFDFTEEREHKLLAAADALLMPSLYEPCGLTQMRAQRYGTLPIVRRVGGLADTVDDRDTGFVFDEYQPWALEGAIQSAIDLFRDRVSWRDHMLSAMARDFSWERSADRYAQVYHRAHEIHRRRRLQEGEGS